MKLENKKEKGSPAIPCHILNEHAGCKGLKYKKKIRKIDKHNVITKTSQPKIKKKTFFKPPSTFLRTKTNKNLVLFYEQPVINQPSVKK